MEIHSFTHSNIHVLLTLSWIGIRQIIRWFILTDFYTMWLDINTYFGSKFSFYRSPSCHVALYAQLFDTINVNYQQSNKLQVMQIIWNVMPYSQHFTFHWKLLVYFYHRRSSNSSSSRCLFLRRRMKVDAFWVTCSLPTTCLKRRQAIKCLSDAPICVLIPSSPSPPNATIINHP